MTPPRRLPRDPRPGTGRHRPAPIVSRFGPWVRRLASGAALCGSVLFAVPGGAASPRDLTVALTPAKDPGLLIEGGRDLQRVLHDHLGIPVTVRVASDYAAVIEALRNRTTDLAFVTAVGYILAHREAGARILVKWVRRGSAFYTSRIYVRRESAIGTLEDLRGRTIAFVDPLSSSGFIYPMVLLMQRGLVRDRDPKTFFREALFAGTHDAALLAVLNGTVDAAAVFDEAPERLLRDPARVARLRAVAETSRIPTDGVCVRDGLDPAWTARLREALLALNAGPGREVLSRLYNVEGVVPAEEADFAPVREALDLMGDLLRRAR